MAVTTYADVLEGFIKEPDTNFSEVFLVSLFEHCFATSYTQGPTPVECSLIPTITSHSRELPFNTKMEPKE